MKNLSKKSISLLIIFTILMAILMPSIVNANSIEYNIWVNGEQFTSEKTSIECGSGSAIFDATTNTLTLDNATIDKVFGFQYGVINSSLPNLTINLVGNNVLDGQNNNDGIDADGGSNVTITGSGTLTIKNMYYGTYIGSWDVAGGDLTIKDTTVNVQSASAAGIWVNHNINFKNSNVQITKTNDSYNGIVSNVGGTITIDGGNVTVNTVKASIHMGNSDDSNHSLVVNSGTLKLTSTGNEGIHVEPVYGTDTINGTITINGGTVDITSSSGGTNIPVSKITINEALGYSNGSSLLDSGNILIKKINTYTVTFNSNGGSTVTSQTVNENEKVTEPTAPTKDGYTFDGWYEDSSLTTVFNFNTAINENKTIYAKWIKNQVTPTKNLTWKVKDGDILTEEIEYDYSVLFWLDYAAYDEGPNLLILHEGDDDNPPQFFNKDNKLLFSLVDDDENYIVKLAEGVNSGDNLTYDLTDEDRTYLLNYGIDLSEYKSAQLIFDVAENANEEKYTVTFNSNGGSSVTNQTVNENAKATEPTTPTKDGYTFDGWYADNTLTTKFDFTKGITANITLYAKWSEIAQTSEDYKILEGADQTHEVENGKDLTIRANGDISKFVELKVDDVTLSTDNYEVKSGSTIATLKSAYLDTLSEGTHKLTFVYNDGEVSTNFKIAKANTAVEETKNETTSSNPKTGDMGIAVWISLMIVSMLGIVGTVKFSKKSK